MELTLNFNSQSKLIEDEKNFNIFLAIPFIKEIDSPQIFKGNVSNSLLFRDLLLLLNEIVDSRFYRQDLWRYLDPVVTCEKDLIRLECFSSCASVYGRVDMESNFFDGYELTQKGTTNVNFNKDFINSLMLLRPNKKANLEVGKDFVALETEEKKVIEEKVKLPERWIKGFLQVQAINRKATKRFELNSISAKQFINSIPAKNETVYIVQKRNSLQISSSQPPKETFMTVSGLNRVRLLKRISSHIKKLDIYEVKETGASVWVAYTENAVVTLGTSSSVKHGYSGEGEALRNIKLSQDNYSLDLAHHVIKNLYRFTIEELSNMLELSIAKATEIVDILSMQGYLGYDSHLASYFYRVLPFADKTNTRLINSKNILENKKIILKKMDKTDEYLFAKALVEGMTSTYITEIKVNNDGYLQEGKCNCPWGLEHGIKRGPCKHMLALRFFAEEKVLETNKKESKNKEF